MHYYTLQNTIRIIVPEGTMQHLTWSHVEADVQNKKREKKQKQMAEWVQVKQLFERRGQHRLFGGEILTVSFSICQQ